MASSERGRDGFASSDDICSGDRGGAPWSGIRDSWTRLLVCEFTAMVMANKPYLPQSAPAARRARKVSPRVKSWSSEHRSVQGRARAVCGGPGGVCVCVCVKFPSRSL